MNLRSGIGDCVVGKGTRQKLRESESMGSPLRAPGESTKEKYPQNWRPETPPGTELDSFKFISLKGHPVPSLPPEGTMPQPSIFLQIARSMTKQSESILIE